MSFQVLLSDINILRTVHNEKLILIIFIIKQSNTCKKPRSTNRCGASIIFPMRLTTFLSGSDVFISVSAIFALLHLQIEEYIL